MSVHWCLHVGCHYFRVHKADASRSPKPHVRSKSGRRICVEPVMQHPSLPHPPLGTRDSEVSQCTAKHFLILELQDCRHDTSEEAGQCLIVATRVVHKLRALCPSSFVCSHCHNVNMGGLMLAITYAACCSETPAISPVSTWSEASGLCNMGPGCSFA